MNRRLKNHHGYAKWQQRCHLEEVNCFCKFTFEIKVCMKLNFKFFNLKFVNLLYNIKYLSLPGNNWENCVVELEQTGTPGEVDFGTLSVFGTKKHKVTFDWTFQ